MSWSRVSAVNGVPIPYGESPAQLEQRLGGSASEAAAAFRALGSDSSSEALEVLVRATSSQDWAIRRLAAEAIGNHPRRVEALATLRPLLSDTSEYVVRTACETLAKLGDHDSHDAIAALLKVPQSATRVGAARALRHLWQESDFPLLLGLMHKDASEDVRKEAAWTLRGAASTSTWAALFEAWKAAPLARHRTWACELAEKYPEERLAADLQVLAEDPDGHVRRAAERALRALRGSPEGAR